VYLNPVTGLAEDNGVFIHPTPPGGFPWGRDVETDH